MRKIIEYKMCGGPRLDGVINDHVNSWLEEGFQPYGYPLIEYLGEGDKKDIFFWQAMVKYEKDN